MGKNSVELEKKMSTVELVSFLEGVTASLKEGKIVIQQGDQFVVLKPEDLITVEIEAGQKNDKGKLSIDLKWLQQAGLPPEADITVGSTEPEPVPEPAPEPDQKPEKGARKEKKKAKSKVKQSPRGKRKAKPKPKE